MSHDDGGDLATSLLQILIYQLHLIKPYVSIIENLYRKFCLSKMEAGWVLAKSIGGTKIF